MDESLSPVKVAHQEIRDIFPTPVIIAQLEDAPALNNALRDVIMAQKKVHEGISRSNIMGWHSDSKMLRWSGAAAERLARTMMQLCGQHTHDLGARNNQSRFRMAIDMWANVSPAGASNQYHAHPACLWSGVYYVDDGGDQQNGPLMLFDPRFPMNKMYSADLVFADSNGARGNTKERIDPVPGRLVIFPSWLTHGVRPHDGPRDRISIAMNLAALHMASGTGTR